jgi:membrane protein YqaA with SNARE-associated domain
MLSERSESKHPYSIRNATDTSRQLNEIVVLYNAGLRTLKLIFNKYTAFIWALLKPLGAWGVFGIGFIDSAFWGLPLDAVVAGYCYANPGRAWMYVLMASAGSALGSSVVYVVGHKGGELLLERRISRERIERMRDKFERQEFLALAIPAMLPPPTPFKLFLLAAAVFQMRYRSFLLAIFVGRVVRFIILALLVLKFGPQIVDIAGSLLRDHLALSLGIFAVGVAAILGWILTRRRRRKKS